VTVNSARSIGLLSNFGRLANVAEPWLSILGSVSQTAAIASAPAHATKCVIGASGTGSIVLEQLARNCVGELVLVDPDHLERKNLNRILNARGCDVDVGRSKVDRAREAILAMELDTAVFPLEKDIGEREAIFALSECDILFGCVDSVDGRHVLNKIATHFLIPLVDLGVRIDADGKGGVDQVCGAIHTVLQAAQVS
jgi:hypothetical protein